MKLLPFLLLFCWHCLAAERPPANAKLEHVELYGHDYVSMADWAKQNGFRVTWTKPQEEVSISNRWARIELRKDSRRVMVNGVATYFSFPAAHRGDVPYITSLDLKTTINPVLFPPKNRGARVRTICLDAGHGGKDPGNQDGVHQEKMYTLLLAEETKKQLLSAGFKVVMTRSTDVYVEREDRPAIARQKRADLFISMHYNSTEGVNNGVSGIEVYCLTPQGASSTNDPNTPDPHPAQPGNAYNDKNMLLAYHLQKHLVRQLGAEDRGVKRQRYAVLHHTEMPAVLIEGGFMNDRAESKKIYDATYRKKMASAITDAIIGYKQLVERP
ncbi:MAG TPA: N-acetylmuramoyl-L-alanine amidase [Verrucomicrobiae bacterium]|nr:N-acetylmuramoyl-L-alanine amidase [Verrucomicrobiae bacterium]